MSDKTLYWLHRKDPRFWEHQEKCAREMHARFAEENKPKEVTLKFSGDNKFYFEVGTRFDVRHI